MSLKIKKLIVSVLAGIVYFLAYVGFGIWPLMFVFLLPMLWVIKDEPPKRIWLYGTVFGFVANMGGFYWVIHLIDDFTDLGLGLAVLTFVLLCAYQAFIETLVLWLARLFQVRLGWSMLLGLVIAFPAVEKAYPLLFPYYTGNAFYAVPVLTQIVDLTGMHGLTILVAAAGGSLWELLSARRENRPLPWKLVAPALLYCAFVPIYGVVRLAQIDAKSAAARKVEVALIQTNLGSRDKAEKSAEFIRRHQVMTREVLASHPEIDLVVWPESAYNRWIPRHVKNLSQEVSPGIHVPIIFGALTIDRGPNGERRSYNTAVLTSSTGDVIGMFDKVVLLAFGETLPFATTFPSIKKLVPRSSFFEPGSRFENFQIPGVGPVMPMVCYEDIIPSFVRDMWWKAGTPVALVNITNDSWYGNTDEPLLHLVLASFRSIETRRALMRSTNTGISAFVDPAGRIVKRSGQWTKEVLVEQVPMIEDGSTTVFMHTGDVVGYGSVVLCAIALFLAIRRGAPNKR